MALDRIPGDANLYIGGLFTLRRKSALQNANITHVVSALRLPLDTTLFTHYTHHVIEIDDVEDENIIEHFPTCNRFIQEGLDKGGGVLVHCLVGKSRSTTLLIAYLLSAAANNNNTHTKLTPSTALALIRQARPHAEPNSGFMSQLELYHSTRCTEDLDNHPAYQRWLYKRTVEASNAVGMAPEVGDLRFGDEGSGGMTTDGNAAATAGTPGEQQRGRATEPSSSSSSPATMSSYRCRRCRTHLATSAYLIPHAPPPGGSAQSSTTSCAHLHLMPLSWMRSELEQGKLEGRLECPNAKCGQSVGRYAWQGMKCSCGQWVVPGMTLGRGRVDEVREKPRLGGGKI